MPLAVTLLGSTFNTSSGTKTVTATPDVGDLIVIIAAHNTTGQPAPTDNNSSGTYTSLQTAFGQDFASQFNVYVRTALIGSASSTVFTHAPGASGGGGLAVLKVTGAQVAGASAVRQVATESTTFGTTPAPVMASAVLTSSAVIGALFNGSNPAGVIERSIYTELLDTGWNTPSSGIEVMAVNGGETGTVLSWGGSSASTFGDIVIELYGPTEILPGLFVNANDFHTPDVITTTYALTAALFTNSTSFHAATISSSLTIHPALFANSNTFYAPTVSGEGALSPALFTNATTFYGPTIARGTVNLAPALFVNSNTFGAASIGTISNIAPPLFANENTFYGPNLRGWIVRSDDATVWTPVVNTSALTDQDGEQITEGGAPITAEGDETWTARTNNDTTWTQAA